MYPSDVSRWQGSVNSWLAQGCVSAFKVNAPDNWIIVDTDMLARGWYDFTILLSGDEQQRYAYIEHRNTPNDGNVNVWITCWQSYNSQPVLIKSWFMEANERLRVRNANPSDSTTIANIHWIRRV